MMKKSTLLLAASLTITSMYGKEKNVNEKNRTIAQAYYTAMSNKDVAKLAQYAHPDVQFVGPLSKTTGKEALIDSVTKFMAFFKKLTIRSTFASDNQAVVLYDVEFPAPLEPLASAAVLTIENGLVTKVELIFDSYTFRKG
jgi:hypothetical protein